MDRPRGNLFAAKVHRRFIAAEREGRGIARTVIDFGGQGEWPTHPELLDWLAVEFVDSGWDVKHMVKKIVMSNAYRQSSVPSQALAKRDPYNRHYARQGRFRIEAEFVRDNALQISGLLETYIGGAQAYSTLGWFNDPVLSTFLQRGQAQLAALLFHELTHRVAYAKNDTAFNESFATTIEQYALATWLAEQRPQVADTAFSDYQQRTNAHDQFRAIVLARRERLSEIYANNALSPEQKRTQKLMLFEDLRSDLVEFDQTLNMGTRYASWAEDINNAKFIPINSYHQWVPAISRELSRQLQKSDCQQPAALLKYRANKDDVRQMAAMTPEDNEDNDSLACKSALTAFYAMIKKVARMDYDARQTLLASW